MCNLLWKASALCDAQQELAALFHTFYLNCLQVPCSDILVPIEKKPKPAQSYYSAKMECKVAFNSSSPFAVRRKEGVKARITFYLVGRRKGCWMPAEIPYWKYFMGIT